MSLLNLLAQDDNAEMKMDISFDLKLHKLDAFSQSNILFDPLGTELEFETEGMLPVFSFGLSEVGPYAFTMPTCNNCLNALLQSVVQSMEIFARVFALSDLASQFFFGDNGATISRFYCFLKSHGLFISVGVLLIAVVGKEMSKPTSMEIFVFVPVFALSLYEVLEEDFASQFFGTIVESFDVSEEWMILSMEIFAPVFALSDFASQFFWDNG
ncbi:hypothetical protein ACJX0J_013157 [Zea mays]